MDEAEFKNRTKRFALRCIKLADSLPKLSPAGRQEYDAREARMIVAMVLARAGLGEHDGPLR